MFRVLNNKAIVDTKRYVFYFVFLCDRKWLLLDLEKIDVVQFEVRRGL